MASVSFGINRGVIDAGPEVLTVGTLAVTTSDIELRWDNTKSLTRREIILALMLFIRRLEDGRYNDPINI